MKNLRFLASLCVLVAPLALTAACSSSDDDSGSVSLTNNSQSDIVEFKVTAVGDDSDFGPNLLGSDPLQPGDTVTVVVTCGSYDLQLTDDTNTTCVIADQNLCATDAAFSITEDDLNACAGF